jgi:periplasmic protein TonB
MFYLKINAMAKDLTSISDFDDIVFESRNKEYGAYVLRKRYTTNLLISLLVGMILLSTAVITPFLNAKALSEITRESQRLVEIKMENLDQPNEQVAPPPPPPPPPSEVIQQSKYIPPVIVDTVKPEETIFMTADEAQDKVQNQEAVEIVETVNEEVKEEETEPQVFVIVEEMPVFPGGVSELMRYVSEHLEYPRIAMENNIQGRVIVQFCVTPRGSISMVSILRGVDPELDSEAIRVVKSLPPFIPGKQGGVPVPVWFQLPITFKLK